MNITVKLVKNQNELDQALSIRKEVFIQEQNIPEAIEMDKFDKFSNHILGYVNKKPVGTARWRITEQGIKLERFAVLKPFRSKGVGKELVKYVLNSLNGKSLIYLNAQESVVTFYKQFGFEVMGKQFYEAGIPHRKMVLTNELTNEVTLS